MRKFCVVFVLLFSHISFAKDSATPITLFVDATGAPRRIIHARLEIPARPGPLTLFYPEWLPGEHSPTGPIRDLTGLKLYIDGKPLSWQRDLVDMYAFHCEVPSGADHVDIDLDYASPPEKEGFSSTAGSTSQLTVISWNQLLLYPQGRPASEISFAASLQLPEGWKCGTALPISAQSGSKIEFRPVSLVTLIDSPVLAGANFKTVELDPHVWIHIAADSASALEMSPAWLSHYKQLVEQTDALFGARHYNNYHFLLTLSDYVAHFGLEHHESSDDRVRERFLLDDNLRKRSGTLLPHEFVHSWNGKYRRPAGLMTPDYQQPMKDDLLWVYEGLTNYLGYILTARSVIWSPEEYRENLARIAANLDDQTGRNWRPLLDTAVAAQLLYSAPEEWKNWRRETDFYDEGSLIWLEADTIIRKQTKGEHSLDDFCRRFHGAPGGPPTVKPYTIEEVFITLGEVAPYDWRTFFNTRINTITPHAPMTGIEEGGWRLVYSELPNSLIDARDYEAKTFDHRFSIGLILKEDGTVQDVVPGLAAAKAGIAPQMKLVAVNGRKWSQTVLRDALSATKSSSRPLELLMENAEYYQTYRLDYNDGLRYPHLERDNSKPDLLSEIIKALAPTH